MELFELNSFHLCLILLWSESTILIPLLVYLVESTVKANEQYPTLLQSQQKQQQQQNEERLESRGCAAKCHHYFIEQRGPVTCTVPFIVESPFNNEQWYDSSWPIQGDVSY